MSKCLLPALILTVVLSATGADQAAGSFVDLAGRAKQALEADRVTEAIDLYGRATKLRPDWSEGWWHLGTLLFDTGRFRESRDAFERFVARETKAGPGFGMLGLSEFQLKHYPRAVSALDHARQLGLGPNAEFARRAVYTGAILHASLQRAELALRLLTLLANEAASAHPGESAAAVLNDAELTDAIGIAALRIPKLPSEVPSSKAALVRQAGRAWALFELKDWVSAEREFRQLSATYPSEPGVHYINGLFFLKTHPEDALAEFRKEIAISPKVVGARVQIALECLRTGDYEQGRRYASESVQLDPGNFAAHVIYSRVWLALEDVARATAEAQIAVKLAPDSPDAHLALFRSYAQAKRTQEAERERKEFERLQALLEKAGA